MVQHQSRQCGKERGGEGEARQDSALHFFNTAKEGA